MATVTNIVDVPVTGIGIERHPRIRNGQACIAGRSVSVMRLVQWQQMGLNAAEIAREVVLSPAQVDAAFAYYATHKAEIDAEIAEEIREADRLEALYARRS